MHATPGNEVNTMGVSPESPLKDKAYAWVRYGTWDGTLDRLQSKDAQAFWRLVNEHRMMGVVSI